MTAAWHFKIYRNCDTLRPRKVVVELWDENGELLDRRRMFGPIFSMKRFKRRLLRKQNRMIRLAEVNKNHSMAVIESDSIKAHH